LISTRPFQLSDKWVGPEQPVYVVAELSANHRGSFDYAVKVIEAAHAAGADAIKLQTYTPDTITLRSDQDLFRVGAGTIWSGRTLYDLYSEAYMPWDWQPKLKEIAGGLGLALFSTPFDNTAVDFLETVGVPAYKIASFELIDIPLIRRVAATGKPVILSTGMATLVEIEDAVEAVRQVQSENASLALLKCTSAYPAAPDDMNLRTIPDLLSRFAVPVGLSDHTLDTAVPVAAVTLGACMIEKHLTLSRSDGGPDATFSLEPDEFRELVRSVRIAERALGRVRYECSEAELSSRKFRRSLFITEDLPAGTALQEGHVRSIRPAAGLAPKYRREVLGRRLKVDVKRGTPLLWELLG
jgi:pseudaminic acid synthase